MNFRKKNIALFLLLATFLSACTVSKKPYFTTTYYGKTEKKLSLLEEKTHCVNDSLFAGFSRISITMDPDNLPKNRHYRKGVPVAGFGQLKTKYATGVHDSLFVRAAALKAGRDTIVILTADLLIMPPNIIREVIALLREKGIRRDQLFLSAVHTHSGPGGWGYGVLARLMAGKENKDIERMLTSAMAEAVLGSVRDIRPAMIGSGTFHAPALVRNRLTGDPRHTNDEFTYMVIDQVGGKRAVIGSFSAHSTTIGSRNTLLSADYPGQWAAKIEGSAASVALFCAGSMGSQSPLGEGKDFERAAYIGSALADSVIYGLSKVKPASRITMASLSLPLALPAYHMRMTKNLNFTTELSSSLMEKPENVYLQALRINNLVWFFTPGDFSGESALLIKGELAGKGFASMVTGYNGSYTGYIIPGKYFWLKHYEPRTMGWFGPFYGDYVTDILNKMGRIIISAK